MQIALLRHHRAGSCNLNQSRAEALPVARRRTAGEGREGAPTSSTSHCAKLLIPSSKTIGENPAILVGMGRLHFDHNRNLWKYPLHELETTYFEDRQ